MVPQSLSHVTSCSLLQCVVGIQYLPLNIARTWQLAFSVCYSLCLLPIYIVNIDDRNNFPPTFSTYYLCSCIPTPFLPLHTHYTPFPATTIYLPKQPVHASGQRAATPHHTPHPTPCLAGEALSTGSLWMTVGVGLDARMPTPFAPLPHHTLCFFPPTTQAGHFP